MAGNRPKPCAPFPPFGSGKESSVFPPALCFAQIFPSAADFFVRPGYQLFACSHEVRAPPILISTRPPEAHAKCFAPSQWRYRCPRTPNTQNQILRPYTPPERRAPRIIRPNIIARRRLFCVLWVRTFSGPQEILRAPKTNFCASPQ